MRMKKTLLLFLIIAMPISMSAVKLTFYPGTIHFRSGESVDYTGIAIPRPSATTVTVSNDPKHKEREKLLVSDILSIALWHENHPDKVGYLYPLQIKKGNDIQTRICLLEHINSWGAVLQMGDFYDISKSDGELYGMAVSKNGTAPVVRHFLLKSGEDYAVLLFSNYSWNPRRSQAAQYFAENQEIADGIAGGNLKTTDIAYIMDAMAMGEGATTTSDDNDDSEDQPATQRGTSTKQPHTARKSATYGIDNDYAITSAVRISYTNFLSPDQLVEAVYARSFSYGIGGVHIGSRWEHWTDVQSAESDAGTLPDSVVQTKASLFLGVSMGGQLPIQLGKYYLIPRLTAGLMLSPFSFTSHSKSMLFAVPLTAGVEFAIPIGGDYAFNIGLHYTYDFHFYDSNDYSMKLRGVGQSGLGASVAFCW